MRVLYCLFCSCRHKHGRLNRAVLKIACTSCDRLQPGRHDPGIPWKWIVETQGPLCGMCECMGVRVALVGDWLLCM